MKTTTFNWDLVLRHAREALVDDYDVLRVLGIGGMGSVYLARRLVDAHTVALKVMHPGLLSDPRNRARFEREACTMTRLSHPHIVRVYAAREIGGLRFLEMRFVERGPLTQLVGQQTRPLPHAIALHWLAQIGSAIAHAHEQDVIHRDLNPGNVLLDAGGDAVVSDFGIAAVADELRLTEVGTAVGTATCMSPEQLDGRGATPASDQYALGCIAYELIAGRRPFYGSAGVIAAAHLNRPPPPLPAGCPAPVAGAIMRMLDKRPEQRFPDISTALRALRAQPLAAGDPRRAALRTLLDP